MSFNHKSTINELIKTYGEEDLTNSIVFALEQEINISGNDNMKKRMYTFSENPSYVRSFILINKHINFHEIILEGKTQKFRYDIDMKISENHNYNEEHDFIQELIKITFDLFEEMGVKLSIQDVSLYESHGEEKRSYHIVFHNHCFFDEKDVKYFFDLALFDINETKYKKYSKYIDPAVYSKNQSFRMLYSTKLGTNRKKKVVKEFDYFGEKIKPKTNKIEKFCDSLISYTHSCKMVPILINTRKIVSSSISNETYNDIMLLFSRKKDNKCFSVRSIKNNIIELTRLQSSYCEVCERPHEHENPKIFILENNVYFNCRRSSDNHYLGDLKNLNKRILKVCPKIKKPDLPQFFMGKLGIKTGNENVGYTIQKKINLHDFWS